MSFDLEKAIREWKSKLRKHSGFEDADIEELEDHLRSSIDDRGEESVEGKFNALMKEQYVNLSKVSDEYAFQRTTSNLHFRLLGNYIKVGLRTLRRHNTFSFINLLGLVTGLASVLSILIYINFELSYDEFHTNHRNIYRLNALFDRPSGSIYYPLIPPAVAPAFQNEFPEIERSARLRYSYNVLLHNEEHSFYEEKVFFAEQAFLDMFSFEWLQGAEHKALTEVNSVVLTQQMATKYFGVENPIGKIITYDNEIRLKVTGVIADVPDQSTINFDFLISFDTFEPGPDAIQPLTSWAWLGFLTYVQLSEQVQVPDLESKMSVLFAETSPAAMNIKARMELQPLSDIYLKSGHLANPQGGLFKTNEMSNLLSLGIVAVLIVLIAFFNYFNITTAFLRTRAKEMGVRKVFGSSKTKIATQMAMETLLMISFATFLAWVIVFISSNGWHILPLLPELPILLKLIGVSVVLVIFFTLVSGILLGAVFSSFSTTALLQKKLFQQQKRISGGSIVLLLQFGISATMIMISLIVVNQIKFLSEKELGYNKEGVLVAKFRSEEMHKRRQTFVEELEALNDVKAVSFAPPMDGSSASSPIRLQEWEVEQAIQVAYFGVDYQFENVIGLQIKDGRFFSKDHASDSAGSLLINETLAKMLGEDDVLHKKVIFAGGSDMEIIGVFKDFHFQSLHHEIGPMALEMWLGQPRNVLIRFDTENIPGTLSDIEQKWADVFQDGAFPFDYRFLDEQLASMYKSEQEFSKLLQVFTGLAIFVALLGLFGLSAVNINLNLKQIGIRRVLGAELKDIAFVVSRKFLVIVVLAILWAIPVVWWLMSKWLENYAYATDLTISYPLITLVVVLAITVATLATQVYRVMTVNPSKILKSE